MIRQSPRLRLEVREDRVNPASDFFADAEVLTGQTAYVIGGNYDLSAFEAFTAEPGEPDHAGVSVPVQSAWYRWTAPISGNAFVMSFDFSFSNGLALAVYTGDSVDALTEVASGSSVGRFGIVTLSFDAVAGTTYSIAVDSVGDALVDFDLYLSVFEPPANDNFADAFALDSAPAPVTVAPASSLAGSSTEPGEPNHSAGVDFGFGVSPLGPSVWYSWTAPTTGRMTVDLNVAYDFGGTGAVEAFTALAVYTGESVSDLDLIANTGGCLGTFVGEELRVSFHSVAGTTYRIAVAGGSIPSSIGLKLYNHAVPGAVVIDGTLLVVGSAGNDTVRVTPFGTANDGSTGVKVRGNFGGPRQTDTFTTSVTAAELYLSDGHDTAEVAGSLTVPVVADLGDGNNTFRGGRGDTIVRAGNGNNSVRTGAGADSVDVGDGNNDIRTGDGDDFVRAGRGDNTIVTGDGNDLVLVNLPSSPVPVQRTGANFIDTGRGDDSVQVLSDGPSVIITGAGNDSVNTRGNGDDVIQTGDGDDFVNADLGDNLISTGAGNDTIFAGAPTLVFVPDPVGNWSNVIDAGSGADQVTVNSNGPTVVFAGAGDDDVVIGFQVVFGPTPPPPITGPAVVFGGSGDDMLIGGAGTDLLDGGAGNDILVGGWGTDILLGGPGSDVLFDGTVSAVGGGPFDPPQLRPVFAAWDPADPATYAAARSNLVVTPDTASADILLGGSGIDWFWSDDPFDLPDITPIEVKN